MLSHEDLRGRKQPPAESADQAVPDPAQRLAALRQSQQRYERATAMGRVGIWELDLISTELYVSPHLLEMLGYAEGELASEATTWHELIHPDDRAKVLNAAKAYLEGASPRYEVEVRRRHKDGSYRWFLARCTITFDDGGRPWRLTGSDTDITERVEARIEVERQSRRLKLLSDCATRLLHDESPEELISTLFPELASQLALDVFLHFQVGADVAALCLKAHAGVDEEMARNLAVVPFGYGICGAVAVRQERQILDDVQNSTDPACDRVRAMGISAYVCHPLIARGQLIGTLSFGARNRARFDAEDLDLMQTVCHQVSVAVEKRQLADELRRQADELARANVAKDRFLATLSHELRTPLAPVVTATQLLSREPNLSETGRESVDMIRRNVDLQTRLIDDLLDLTRISCGKLELQLAAIDLGPLVRSAVQDCDAELRNKRITVSLELPEQGCTVRADAARVNQILWNLLKNAVKFTPDGGSVTLRAAADAGGAVRLQVIDTGVGIEPEILPRIFDAFEQGGRHTTRAFGGLGLGLNISRALAEFQHGKLTAHSDGKDRGATFTLELPSCPPPTEAPQLPASPAAAVSGCRILLVEDNVDTARSLAQLLATSGHHVDIADGVSAALNAVEQHASRSDEEIDLVISDIGLPDGSGLDLMRSLVDRFGLKGVALSGYGMEEDVRRSYEAGFSDHLTKPVDLARLDAAIASAMAARSSAHAQVG